MISKIFLMSALIVGGASVASAQDAASTTTTTTTATTVEVPTCSKTVTDKCINRTATTKKVVHSHKATVKKTSKVTTKTTG